MTALTLPAPAKLNIFLHVVGRRADGYHELQSAFQFVDICDRVRLELVPGGEIRRSRDLPGVSPEVDLTLRAAAALKAATGARDGVDIRVDKRIPTGGGLGGGSSDAATVLVGLNALWGLGLTVDELAAIGLGLGADVPVFVRGRAAWAEGVGERLTPLDLERPWYLVVNPGCEVSTPLVFKHSSLTRNTPVTTISDLLRAASVPEGRALGVEQLFSLTGNDCEPVARLLFDEVGEALDWLRERAPARMTGTGATVFAPFATRELARRARRALPARWTGLVARGLNDSPLLATVAQPGRSGAG